MALKNWVDSHTPWEIHVANRARMVLRRKYNVSARKTIPDPRYPKQPQTPFGIFLKAQHETRDFGDVTFTEAMSQIGAEWKKLTPEERKVWWNPIRLLLCPQLLFVLVANYRLF